MKIEILRGLSITLLAGYLLIITSNGYSQQKVKAKEDKIKLKEDKGMGMNNTGMKAKANAP